MVHNELDRYLTRIYPFMSARGRRGVKELMLKYQMFPSNVFEAQLMITDMYRSKPDARRYMDEILAVTP